MAQRRAAREPIASGELPGLVPQGGDHGPRVCPGSGRRMRRPTLATGLRQTSPREIPREVAAALRRMLSDP